MRRLHASIGFVLLMAAAANLSAAEPKTEDDKALYALGVAVSQNLSSFDLTPAELEIVKQGFNDGATGKAGKIDFNTYLPKLRELQTTRTAAAGKAALDKAAAEKGAKKLPSGLVFTSIKEGTGPSPVATDRVKVHYHGTLPNGKVFDSSVERNEPATFPLNGVIPCWTEGVQLMKVGGKAKLTCPASIAYGDRGAPPDIGPGATLIFQVELLAIEKPAATTTPPPAPAPKQQPKQ